MMPHYDYEAQHNKNFIALGYTVKKKKKKKKRTIFCAKIAT